MACCMRPTRARNQRLDLDHSHVSTPQSSLNLNGAVSKNSSLAVQLQANDLRELEAIADLFRTPAPGQPLQQLGLSGTASFNGVVRGSTSAPHLTGQLTAQNLQVQGSAWRLLRTNIDASPSQISLQHAELDPAAQGRVTLNASAQLHKWSFSKSSAIQLQLNASQLDLSELAKLAGQQIPATGTLSADIKMHGSILNPQGNGTITLGEGSRLRRTYLDGQGHIQRERRSGPCEFIDLGASRGNRS